MKHSLIKLWITSLLLFFTQSVLAENKSDFTESEAQYHILIEKKQYQEALVFSKNNYELAKEMFEPLSSNNLMAIDNYALNLQLANNLEEARLIFLELLNHYENKYGKHAQALLPILSSVNELNKQLSSTVSDEEAKAVAIRFYKLHLRYNSDEFVAQLAETNLTTTEHAKNTLKKVTRLLGNDYEIFETAHWSIIYPKEKLSFVSKRMAKAMELTYQNNLSFLVAMGLRNKPIETKMTAVYFANRDDFRTYQIKITGDKKAANSSTSFYSPKAQSIFMYDRGKNKKGKDKHVSPQTVIFDVSLQVFHQTGLLPKTVIFPKWFRKGLAVSFRTSDKKRPFGPHHDNYHFKTIKNIKTRYEDNTLASLHTLVTLDGDEEDFNNKEHLFDISQQGSMLIRFLYQYYPDELIDYIGIINKSRSAKYERGKFGKNIRLKQFQRAFGEPDNLQKQYNRFLEETFIQSEKNLKAFKKRKKSK